MSTLKHWKTHTEDNILWVGFDKAHASANTLNDEVLDELNSIFIV